MNFWRSERAIDNKLLIALNPIYFILFTNCIEVINEKKKSMNGISVVLLHVVIKLNCIALLFYPISYRLQHKQTRKKTEKNMEQIDFESGTKTYSDQTNHNNNKDIVHCRCCCQMLLSYRFCSYFVFFVCVCDSFKNNVYCAEHDCGTKFQLKNFQDVG